MTELPDAKVVPRFTRLTCLVAVLTSILATVPIGQVPVAHGATFCSSSR